MSNCPRCGSKNTEWTDCKTVENKTIVVCASAVTAVIPGSSLSDPVRKGPFRSESLISPRLR